MGLHLRDYKGVDGYEVLITLNCGAFGRGLWQDAARPKLGAAYWAGMPRSTWWCVACEGSTDQYSMGAAAWVAVG